MAMIDDNINNLFDLAQNALSIANGRANSIGLTSYNAPSSKLDYTPGALNLEKPLALGDFLSPDTSAATVKYLNGEAEKWLDKFFPEIQACLRTAPEEWLCGIITGQKPFGLSKEVFEAVWHESRDREYRARNSEVRQLHAEFSSRGFSLPVGAHVAAISQAEERASDAISQVNRAQTVKDAEIKLDLLKFAEEQAIKLKLGVLNAMADFYRMWIELPNKEIEANRTKTQAYASFQSALSSYYNVQLGFEELRLRAAEVRMNGKLDVTKLNASMVGADGRNAALGVAADAFGKVAASAASAASTLVAQIETA